MNGWVNGVLMLELVLLRVTRGAHLMAVVFSGGQVDTELVVKILRDVKF